MGKIIDLTEHLNRVRPDHYRIAALRGAMMKVVSIPKEKSELRNDRILMPGEADDPKRLDYIKRYTTAQMVDMVLQRMQEDKEIADKPVVMVLYPQTTKPEPMGEEGCVKLRSKMEVGVLAKIQFTKDTEFEIIEE